MTQQSTTGPTRKRQVAHWHADQLVITHHSFLDITAGTEAIIASLDLETLDGRLTNQLGYQLIPFTESDVPRKHRSHKGQGRHRDDDVGIQQSLHTSATSGNDTTTRKRSLQHPVGKYMFPHPSGKGTLVMSFFHIQTGNKTNAVVASGSANEGDSTTKAVNLINESPIHFISSHDAKIVGAMPNWFNAGTNGPNIIVLGCPVSPPVPANGSADTACTSGNWHITLPPDLPSVIQNATGAGVKVFVLDTLPPSAQIEQAVANSGGSNPLLLDFFEHVTPNYQVLPDALDTPQSSQPATGNDASGELVGFPMNDHGVFVAGIIRDLAPDASVECIRVLNDYCVGDTTTLVNAWMQIQNRLQSGGDLHNTPVVVNMSLTTTPAEEALAGMGFTDASMVPVRLGLLQIMQTLAGQGVVFTASSGNGSGPHDKITNPPGERLRPRYPAAFAYPLPGTDPEQPGLASMIPVGAVNQSGAASSYSNYPGPLGIGAYAGEIPQVAQGPQAYNNVTGTQAQPPIDALRGLYTAAAYPALLASDALPMTSPPPIAYPEYVPSPAVTWAYWSGTSFATPVISALAARVMETQPSADDSVRQAILNATSAKVDWTNLSTGGDASGPMIMVSQACAGDTTTIG